MENDLTNYRNELDKINEDMLSLHEKRLSIVRKVAQYKINNHLPVFHAGREQEIIENMCRLAPAEDEGGIRLLFNSLMRISRQYQYQMMYQDSHFFQKLQQMKQTQTPLPSHPVIACQGVKGSYSSRCAHELFGDNTIDYYSQFDDVFSAVKNGQADLGILPIENSYAGSILPVFDLMKKNEFYIYQSHKVRIQHCLLGVPGASLSDITDVYSHEQGILQTSDFLKRHPNICPHTYSNTAAAAQYVNQSGDKTKAAIASYECSEIYGLTPILENIQDAQDNYTRFISITKKFHINEKANKISVFLTLPNKTGSLNDILSRFAICNLNLTKLESRPMDSKFSYLFFMEFEGNIFHENVEKLLCQLHEELDQFTFLGNYYDDNHLYE